MVEFIRKISENNCALYSNSKIKDDHEVSRSNLHLFHSQLQINYAITSDWNSSSSSNRLRINYFSFMKSEPRWKLFSTIYSDITINASSNWRYWIRNDLRSVSHYIDAGERIIEY